MGSGGKETRSPRLKRGYKLTCLYGFVRPESGEVYWLILPTVNVVELFSMALGEFAREVGAGKDKHILVVVDQAGWHTGGEVELPEGVHLEFLPSRARRNLCRRRECGR